MTDEEMTCGEELAASAEVPEQLGALIGHVASNMEAHARWVGVATEAARGEHDAMLAIAGEYRQLSAAAARAAALMQSMKSLPAAAHDHARLDVAGLAIWMQAKIRMQREFAELLLVHATESELALAQLERRAKDRDEHDE